ncbi:hypothetical protein, partial [Cellulomonas biazotea]|uniref:hypothetical protein n=1 Tax=Cellulomonas biazotea TaxID=1709 RepID=UPI0035E83681
LTADMMVNTSNSNVNLDSTKSMSDYKEGQTVQRVIQQLENTSFANPEQAKQKVLKEVQQGSFTSDEQKQRVIQEIQQANIASPAQAKQNVEQVLASAKIKPDVQQSVQKIFQDVEQTSSSAPANLKTKVIQELENKNFGSKEPIKQTIMRNIERGFNATPKQLEQNVKQTISRVQSDLPTTENNSEIKQQRVVRKEEQAGYFGHLSQPEVYDNVSSQRQASRSRYDKFKRN